MKNLKSKISFKEEVREIVRKIPKGTTLAYKEVAIKAGNHKAARAVANIMASNYDSAIPCHRVIRTNGQPGGYNRGGIVKKRKLLQEEGVKL